MHNGGMCQQSQEHIYALRPCSDGDGTERNGTERNGTERNDCVPTLFCVQTGTQSFHHTIVRPGLCHTLDRPFIFFIAQSA